MLNMCKKRFGKGLPQECDDTDSIGPSSHIPHTAINPLSYLSSGRQVSESTRDS